MKEMSMRAQRVAEMVRVEVAQLLMDGVKDPRIGFVSVMAVRMSPDLRYANVYVSVYGSEKERKGSLAGLRNCASWMRGIVGRNLRLRMAPEIRFFEDDTLDQVYHLEEVFQKLHESENSAQSGGQPEIETGESDADSE